MQAVDGYEVECSWFGGGVVRRLPLQAVSPCPRSAVAGAGAGAGRRLSTVVPIKLGLLHFDIPAGAAMTVRLAAVIASRVGEASAACRLLLPNAFLLRPAARSS